jgi:hypothetical protein
LIPVYSPDLPLCCVFHYLIKKNDLEGLLFDTVEEIQKVSRSEQVAGECLLDVLWQLKAALEFRMELDEEEHRSSEYTVYFR